MLAELSPRVEGTGAVGDETEEVLGVEFVLLVEVEFKAEDGEENVLLDNVKLISISIISVFSKQPFNCEAPPSSLILVFRLEMFRDLYSSRNDSAVGGATGEEG